MSLLGNIFWLIFGGLLVAAIYFVMGIVFCITIIGIPFGIKLFEMAGLALAPFGKVVSMDPASGCLTTAFNILWIVFGWWEIAAIHLVFGVLLCITIVGIPLGKQHFKLARYSFLPFGCKISRS